MKFQQWTSNPLGELIQLVRRCGVSRCLVAKTEPARIPKDAGRGSGGAPDPPGALGSARRESAVGGEIVGTPPNAGISMLRRPTPVG
jgi:hypothetical protein